MSIRIGDRIISGGGGGNGESLTNQNLSSDITQVYNWVGTYADYVEQDVANTHPDWVCYITDDEFGDEQEYEIVQYTARNVGDIFFTSRKDTWLNGAVECNGNTYSINDFEGNESIGELLKKNLVPYVSMSEYETLLTNNGSVGVFGWNGGDNNQFRVPTLNDLFLETGKATELGEFIQAGLPNITGEFEASDDNSSTITIGAFQIKANGGTTTGGEGREKILTFDASRSSSIYGNSTTVQPKSIKYRPMVQLSNGFTDEAVETCQSVKADVENLKEYDYVVDWQIPTSENGYTWYRKYKSGWVEQGGFSDTTSGTVNIILPIVMADSNYSPRITQSYAPADVDIRVRYIQSCTTTTIYTSSVRGVGFYWQVSGMAAQ